MLSVVIPCQEDEMLLVPTLKSIFLNQFRQQDFEVLVVCSDRIRVSDNVMRFPVQMHSGEFRGQAHALNWGLENARGDIVCTTKPGCVVAANWLSEIDQFLQYKPEVDGVGGPILPCWEYGTDTQKLASQIFHEEQGFPEVDTLLKLGNHQGLLHATNSAFRKEVLIPIKFDESFRYDFDFDVCWKMLRKGCRLAYNSRMRVRYIFPLSMRGLLTRYYHWGRENVILRRRYSYQTGWKSHLYAPYRMYQSLLQPSSLVSRKKMLRFIQHLAFNFGYLDGLTVNVEPCAS